MGSSASKSETKVFSPKAPVDYSASFLSHLENNQESDFTRAQYTESYIQDRVASELQKLEREAIDKYQTSASGALLKGGADNVSFSSSNEKVSHLTETLKNNSASIKIELDASVQDARQAVINCLKDNKGKTLNCWDEVENFKQMIHNL